LIDAKDSPACEKGVLGMGEGEEDIGKRCIFRIDGGDEGVMRGAACFDETVGIFQDG
jgi:hypothetical protein